ncbi:hypothetical protein J3R82DRAFT_10481 [Butyriboletus roseoflavus]|nr:hypothetical protein J3R82DRAFT_10481 [Butyriboletus roseoflavus]
MGDIGATLNVQTTFEVVDVNVLTSFTTVLLNEDSFQWEISGENLTGVQVPGILLPFKVVTLNGFNGLQTGVTINLFNLPTNDPSGGIQLIIQSTVINPSQVGIKLSSITFNTYASEIEIAPISSLSSVTLTPQSTLTLPLAGQLVPQNTTEDLAVVSMIFNNFIQGKDSQVTVQEASAGPTNVRLIATLLCTFLRFIKVTWLNEGIQTLQVVTSLSNQGKLNI